MNIRFALASLALVVGSAPAAAVVTTFAAFQPLTSGVNFANVNGSVRSVRPGSTAPNSVNVRFSFLSPQLSSINGVTAAFTFATSFIGAASVSQGNLTQDTGPGSFSFRSTAPITVNGITYATGSNLLSGTFTRAEINGLQGSTSASLIDSTGAGSVVTFSSDFMAFGPGTAGDIALALTALQPSLNRGGNGQLRNFRGVASGNFSTSMINGIPEPAVWGLMLGGFAFTGFAARRRTRLARSVTA